MNAAAGASRGQVAVDVNALDRLARALESCKGLPPPETADGDVFAPPQSPQQPVGPGTGNPSIRNGSDEVRLLKEQVADLQRHLNVATKLREQAEDRSAAVAGRVMEMTEEYEQQLEELQHELLDAKAEGLALEADAEISRVEGSKATEPPRGISSRQSSLSVIASCEPPRPRLGAAKLRRSFLRSIEDIVGHRHPETWRDEFRDLLLIQDAMTTTEESDRQRHREKTSQELLEHYLDVDGGGYYRRQIDGMVRDGWDERWALPVRLLPAFGGAALSIALRTADPTLAGSLTAVADGVAMRSLETAQWAPDLYISMLGIPEKNLYGLQERDVHAAKLGRKSQHAETIVLAPPLMLGDDPTLLSEAGYSFYHGGTDSYLLGHGDIVCIRSSVQGGGVNLHTAVLCVSRSQVPRYVLPPNVLLTQESITLPPWEATFNRWHVFHGDAPKGSPVGTAGPKLFVDRKLLINTGKKVMLQRPSTPARRVSIHPTRPSLSTTR